MTDQNFPPADGSTPYAAPSSPPQFGGPTGDLTQIGALPQWGAPAETGPVAPFDLTAPATAATFDAVADDADLPAASGRKGRRVAALGAAAALLAAGGFGVWQLTTGADGGADSPEAAVEALLGAANKEDAIGAMDILLPGERRTFKQPMLDMVKELTRLEILDAKATMDKVAGLDIEITTTSMASQSVADDIATVMMSGTTSMSTDAGALPLGATLDELLGSNRPQSTSEITNFDDSRITTVKKDGRWYVSLWYSAAEAARGTDGAPVPETGLTAVGGSTPEDGMDLLLKSVTDLSVEGMIESLNPDEAEALQRYAPLFLDDAQRSLDEGLENSDVKLTLTDTSYKVTEISDGRVGVVPQSLTLGITSEQLDATAALKDGCFVVDYTMRSPEGDENKPGTFNSCEMTNDTEKAAEALGDSDEAKELAKALDNVRAVFDDFESAGITMVQTGGKWYVAPLGSYMDMMLDVAQALDDGEIEVLRDNVEGAMGGLRGLFAGMVMGAMPGSDEVFGESDSGFAESDGVGDALVDCMMTGSTEGRNECLDEAVADGRLTEQQTPADYRFPECGYAELEEKAADGLGDAEFTELATKAEQCFAAKVAAGELSRFEVPVLAIDTSCFGGKNPFTTDDGMESAMECLNG